MLTACAGTMVSVSGRVTTLAESAARRRAAEGLLCDCPNVQCPRIVPDRQRGESHQVELQIQVVRPRDLLRRPGDTDSKEFETAARDPDARDGILRKPRERRRRA